MANLVIKFRSNTKKEVQTPVKNTEIYKDVSLQSKSSIFKNLESYVDPKKTQSSKYKVSKSVNIKAVQNAIQNIFNFFPGERVLYPEFGSRLKMHLYNGITQFNQEMIVSEIYSNLEMFDPRVIVKDIAIVTSDKDKDDNTVTLRIIYCIDGLPDEYYSYDYSYVAGD